MVDILVVEDERLIARLLKETLEVEGYRVVTVLNGEDAVRFALHETPRLIMLDIMLPGIDGYEVIRQLRSHPKTMHIPILILSALGEPTDKIRAYDIGVDGYITKPFDTDELLARVRRQFQRVEQHALSPLTGLPGGIQVIQAISSKLSNSAPWSMLYLDLDNFKAFNDVYGFLTGNDMIVLVGRICQEEVYELGNPDDFVGHIGGDDFVVVTTPERAKILCRSITERYKEESVSLYYAEDLLRGSISGVDRKGRPYQFPLVSLSIGVVNNLLCRPHSIQEVSYLAAEAKCNAKQSTNNICYISPQRSIPVQEHRTSTAPLGPLPKFLFSASSPFSLLSFTEEGMAEYEQQLH